MKFCFSLLLLCFTGISFSQSIETKETTVKFSSGSQNAIVTTIYGNAGEEVIDEWKKVLKDYKNEKVKVDGNEVFGDNILVKEWGNNPVDFYARFDENKNDKTVKMSVAVDLGGAYLSSSLDKTKFRDLEKLVKDFALKSTKEPIEKELKTNTKVHEKLLDQQKNLEKDKKSLLKDIENYREKIAKAEKEIVGKEAEIEKKKEEVNTQKKVVEACNGAVSEQAASSKKIYDKLVDKQKDLENDVRNLKEDIENYRTKIKKAEEDLKKNEEDQLKKKEELDNQQKKITQTKDRLDAVN